MGEDGPSVQTRLSEWMSGWTQESNEKGLGEEMK